MCVGASVQKGSEERKRTKGEGSASAFFRRIKMPAGAAVHRGKRREGGWPRRASKQSNREGMGRQFERNGCG